MPVFIGFLPKDAVPIRGANTTDITDTTAQAILAAPADAAQAYYLTSIVYLNRTEAEVPFIRIQDDAATPLRLDGANLKTPNGSVQHVFWPPIKVATGAAVNGVATSAVGDTEVYIHGFRGTP